MFSFHCIIWTTIDGSGDGGVTVRTSDEKFNQMMIQFGEYLHLRPHRVSNAILSSAGDVEDHYGHDGRYYLLDLARTFPPESPNDTPHLIAHPQAVFFRLLRPEFLQILKNTNALPPLNSDGLTNWARLEPNVQSHNADIKHATQIMIQDLVPKFASWLQQWVLTASHQEKSNIQLATLLHKRGINVRHIGLVRSHISPNSEASSILLVEMVFIYIYIFVTNKQHQQINIFTYVYCWILILCSV